MSRIANTQHQNYQITYFDDRTETLKDVNLISFDLNLPKNSICFKHKNGFLLIVNFNTIKRIEQI